MNGFMSRLADGFHSRRILKGFATLPVLATSLASAATFTVTQTGDSGAGSLRWAIDQSNARPGVDRITFNIPGPGPHAIEILSQLPDVQDTCDVERATDLKSTAWLDASGLQPGVGDVILWEDPNPITGPQTFYRIRLD